MVRWAQDKTRRTLKHVNAGPYLPLLTVTNTVGATATTSRRDDYRDQSDGEIHRQSCTNACPLLTIHFTSPATDSGGNKITNWFWNFLATVPPVLLENPTHVYSSVSDLQSCIDRCQCVWSFAQQFGPGDQCRQPNGAVYGQPEQQRIAADGRLQISHRGQCGRFHQDLAMEFWRWHVRRRAKSDSYLYQSRDVSSVFDHLQYIGINGDQFRLDHGDQPCSEDSTVNHTNACPLLTIQFTSPRDRQWRQQDYQLALEFRRRHLQHSRKSNPYLHQHPDLQSCFDRR